MVFYFDENSKKLEELKDKTLSWKPGMEAFFGYFLDSVQKLFAGVDQVPDENRSNTQIAAGEMAGKGL